MESVLIVSSSEKGRQFFEGLLPSGSFSRIRSAYSGSEARRLLLSAEFDLIVINTPLADEFGWELAAQLAQSTLSGILLAVKSELAGEVEGKVEDSGVLVLEKPVNRAVAYQMLKMAAASRNRLAVLREENLRLQRRLEELKLVDRAKCALIQYLNMTEQQAHRYIEKQAMDLRSTRREVAEEILKAYES